MITEEDVKFDSDPSAKYCRKIPIALTVMPPMIADKNLTRTKLKWIFLKKLMASFSESTS
jgi:hypothetical protein